VKMKTFLLTEKTLVWGPNSKAVETDRKHFPRRPFPPLLVWCLTIGIFAALAVSAASASGADDKKTVAALDTEYQAAVKKNDAATMERILADDFVLVTGSGKTFTKADLLRETRSGDFVYEHQEDSEQTVRVWGDTAVVTAKLWGKGTDSEKPFDHTLWFSDTYVRTPAGWRYVFGQVSLPLTTPGSDKH
jgi:ketosteroid isomerase-like protein